MLVYQRVHPSENKPTVGYVCTYLWAYWLVNACHGPQESPIFIAVTYSLLSSANQTWPTWHLKNSTIYRAPFIQDFPGKHVWMPMGIINNEVGHWSFKCGKWWQQIWSRKWTKLNTLEKIIDHYFFLGFHMISCYLLPQTSHLKILTSSPAVAISSTIAQRETLETLVMIWWSRWRKIWFNRFNQI